MQFINNQNCTFIFYQELYFQPSFRSVLFFLGVAYTQLLFEFLKLHSEPFEYGHAVNAQPEFPILLRASLYGCRRVVCLKLLLVFLRIEPAFEPYGLQADDLPCQFFGEPHFPALFGYGQQFRYDCLLYTSPSPRDRQKSRMPSSA